MWLISKRPNVFLASLGSGQRVMLAVLACAAMTLLATPLREHLDLVNIVMLFLLTVLLVAVSLGLRAALVSAFLSVALFDFFFVPPRFSFEVHDGQYLVTFVVMLAVALITGQLTAGLRRQAEDSATEAQRTHALYEMARDLTGALMVEQVIDITRDFLRGALRADARIVLADSSGKFSVPADAQLGAVKIEPRLATIAFETGKMVESGGLAGNGYAALYLPLQAPMDVHGVLAIASTDVAALRAQHVRLQTMASLAGIAIERLHYVEVAQRTQMQVVAERLRNSILSALSHDVRTPLTALVGLADSLTVTRPPLPELALETAVAIREQAERVCGLVGNLLDMARLQAGEVIMHKEWQPIEEVIGSSIKLLGRALAAHPVKVALAPDFPLLEFDAVMIERVFCNLLENAAKYTPPGSTIDIDVARRDGRAVVSVCDRGCGFVEDGATALFEMFVRGDRESATPGVGLGLAICRAITEAHAGSITASNREQGGACITFSLPLGEPPIIEEEDMSPAGSAS